MRWIPKKEPIGNRRGERCTPEEDENGGDGQRLEERERTLASERFREIDENPINSHTYKFLLLRRRFKLKTEFFLNIFIDSFVFYLFRLSHRFV